MNLVTKVAGVTFDNPDGSSRQEAIQGIGASVWRGNLKEFTLEREPDNPHDPNSVKVLYDNKCVGYIPKEQAIEVTKFVERDKVRAIQLHETGKHEGIYFLSISMILLEN